MKRKLVIAGLALVLGGGVYTWSQMHSRGYS
jgi:hypothetical protein